MGNYVRNKIRASKRNPSKRALAKVASSGDNFKFKSKDELLKRLWRHESRLADMLDDLDQWHSPGSGTALDRLYKKIQAAHTAARFSIDTYDPARRP